MAAKAMEVAALTRIVKGMTEGLPGGSDLWRTTYDLEPGNDFP